MWRKGQCIDMTVHLYLLTFCAGWHIQQIGMNVVILLKGNQKQGCE